MSGLRELADKWEREQAEYPPTPEGQHAAAAVRCCIHELRALATRTPPQPSPVQGDGVSDPLVERACIAAYNECDMGSFPEQAVNPESDRRFVRAALAAAQPGSGFVVPCKGADCGSTNYRFHSAACFAEHEATVAAAAAADQGSAK